MNLIRLCGLELIRNSFRMCEPTIRIFLLFFQSIPNFNNKIEL